jgi:hypothetical protein
MRSNIRYAVTAALLLASSPALASTVSVATDPNAPTSNFGSPSNTATAGYTLTLSDDGNSVIGSIVQTGGVSAGPFANLYFDLNPSVMNGSDLGFELGTASGDAFIPGINGNVALNPSSYTFSAVTVGGLTTLNFSLANSLFTSPIAGLNYYAGQTFENNVTLRLSQSLSYSVAGGATYGPNRLGTVNVGSAAAVPETATWGMMIAGFGMIGAAMRYRRRSAKVTFA